MAKKEVTFIGYKPPIDANQVLPLVKQEIIQIPPYPDSGVAYAGKYKTKKAENSFELKNQQAINIKMSLIGTSSQFAYLDCRSRTFYLTGIFCSYQIANPLSDNQIGVSLSSDDVGTSIGSNFFTIMCAKSSDSFNIDYSSAPVRLTVRSTMPYLRFMFINLNNVAADRATIEIIGFTEDN